MGSNKTADSQRQVLNQLVLAPKFKPAARKIGLDPTTVFRWIRESVANPEKHTLEWLGFTQPFHLHARAARLLNVQAIDANARSLAVNGHSSPRFFNGAPVWKVDEVIAADALTLDVDAWFEKYGARLRSDTLARDPETGGLIQEVDVSPPNPALLIKLLTSLAPEIYGERSEVNVTHQGSVWIEGSSTQSTPAALPAPDNFSADFGLTQRPEEVQRPTNTLAVPRACKDSEEFDRRFRKKLLREVVLFRDSDDRLLPILPDDVLVIGSHQYRALQDAGLDVSSAVHPTVLLDEGFQNDWLIALAPGYKPKPPKPAPESTPRPAYAKPLEVELVPVAPVVEKPGMASARYDSERLGPGRPPPGGRKISL